MSSQVAISCLRTRTRSIRIAEAKKLATRNERPARKECVRVSKYPTINGPTNPPRFPTELMSPIEAAAADSVRNALGTGQKAGWKPKYAPPTPTKNSIERKTLD